MADFATLGWEKFDYDPDLARWLDHIRPHAMARTTDPEHLKNWSRLQGSWFVGADVLGNDETGALEGSGPLSGHAAAFCQDHTGPILDWGPGQVSTCYPNYPLKDDAESEANHRYRIKRASAHLDGLKAEGPERRRYLLEFHQFILGLPLNRTEADAAPFVIWEGSHVVLQDMLVKAFAQHAPEDWHKIDLTETYQQTRADIFENCKRIEIHASPGEAYIAHRFALHGVAPWGRAKDAHRTILYFRPFWQGDLSEWISL